MLLLPKELYEKLEFDKVLQLLEKECLGAPAGTYFEFLEPSTELSLIEKQLKEVKELKLSLEKNDKFPLVAYETFEEELKMLPLAGWVLTVDSLQRINRTLLIFRELYKFFTQVRREIYPTLYFTIRDTVYDESLAKEITRVIDPEGVIRPDASSELMKIRRSIQSKQRELESVYKRIISEYRQKGWLTDNAETLRNGRRVLAVPSEHKRSIRGIIHDESTTGKTTYIEPEAAIEVNNDLFDLEQEEKQEIYRIMRALSDFLRPYVGLLETYSDIIIAYDIIHAKARLAMRMKAFMPQLSNAPTLGIKKGRHPLLYLKNKLAGRETVPFNLDLFRDNRILLVSGPNAGGKSILMKSVGLIQIMLQCGLLVPVSELSDMGIFEKIFVNIGDSQSFEDDLSTYSSHLQNMKAFTEQADEQSLILIDEFGSGTDPKMGGAIAEGIMRKLNEKKVYGVVTTHYGNLKMFAYRTEGIINGCMNFDKDNLKPTYQLTIGRPGSSYAFEIAQNVGLSKEVLQYARKRIGENEHSVDELLVDLQREKQEYDVKLKEITEKQDMLDKLIKQYDENIKDVEQRRKLQKLDAKEFELQKAANARQEVQNLLKELKQEKNIQTQDVASALKEIKIKQQELAEEASKISEDLYAVPSAGSLEIQIGSRVKMRAGSAEGRVEAVKDKTATVIIGAMRVKVKTKDLVALEEPVQQTKSSAIKSDIIQCSAIFDPKTDVRGMMAMEAEKIIEDFMDNAVVSSANILRIVHGKGNGVLRKVVKQKLKEYKSIKKVYHPEQNDGGDGVTVVEL